MLPANLYDRRQVLNGVIPVLWGPKQQTFIDLTKAAPGNSVPLDTSYAPPLDWPKAGTLVRCPQIIRFLGATVQTSLLDGTIINSTEDYDKFWQLFGVPNTLSLLYTNYCYSTLIQQVITYAAAKPCMYVIGDAVGSSQSYALALRNPPDTPEFHGLEVLNIVLTNGSVGTSVPVLDVFHVNDVGTEQELIRKCFPRFRKYKTVIFGDQNSAKATDDVFNQAHLNTDAVQFDIIGTNNFPDGPIADKTALANSAVKRAFLQYAKDPTFRGPVPGSFYVSSGHNNTTNLNYQTMSVRLYYQSGVGSSTTFQDLFNVNIAQSYEFATGLSDCNTSYDGNLDYRTLSADIITSIADEFFK